MNFLRRHAEMPGAEKIITCLRDFGRLTFRIRLRSHCHYFFFGLGLFFPVPVFGSLVRRIFLRCGPRRTRNKRRKQVIENHRHLLQVDTQRVHVSCLHGTTSFVQADTYLWQSKVKYQTALKKVTFRLRLCRKYGYGCERRLCLLTVNRAFLLQTGTWMAKTRFDD